MRTLIFIILSNIITTSLAQVLTVGCMDQLPQSSIANPAISPAHEGPILSLPSLALNYENSAFTFNDLVRRYSPDSVIYDVSNVLTKLDSKNHIRYQLNANLFRLTWKKEKYFFTIMMADRMDAKFSYRKDLVDFFWNGNALRLGDTLSIAPQLDAIYYREFGIGIGYSFPKWSIGLRTKALFGLGHALTKNSDLRITTDVTDFSTTFYTDYSITTAGIKNFREDRGRASLNLLNPGYALDIGVSAEVVPDLYLGISVNDLGKILWKNDVMNLDNNGSYTFRGIEIAQDFKLDSAVLKNLTDTLVSSFNPIVDSPAYWSRLKPNGCITLQWKIDTKTSIGALAFAEYASEPAISFFASRQVFSFLNVGCSVSRKNESWKNVGAAITARVRKLQVYFLSDNLTGLVAARNSKNINFQTGANIFLGRYNHSALKL